MEPTPTPHDCFFRESFGQREIAQDFLRYQLPAALLAEVALTTLTIAKDTYSAPLQVVEFLEISPLIYK